MSPVIVQIVSDDETLYLTGDIPTEDLDILALFISSRPCDRIETPAESREAQVLRKIFTFVKKDGVVVEDADHSSLLTYRSVDDIWRYPGHFFSMYGSN